MTSISGGVNHVGLDLGTLLVLYAWSRPGSSPDWLLHIRGLWLAPLSIITCIATSVSDMEANLSHSFLDSRSNVQKVWTFAGLHLKSSLASLFSLRLLWFRSNPSHRTKTGLIFWFFEVLFRGNRQSIAIRGDHFNCLRITNATCLIRQRLRPSLDLAKGRQSVHPYQMLVCVWSQSRNSFWLKKPW